MKPATLARRKSEAHGCGEEEDRWFYWWEHCQENTKAPEVTSVTVRMWTCQDARRQSRRGEEMSRVCILCIWFKAMESELCVLAIAKAYKIALKLKVCLSYIAVISRSHHSVWGRLPSHRTIITLPFWWTTKRQGLLLPGLIKSDVSATFVFCFFFHHVPIGPLWARITSATLLFCLSVLNWTYAPLVLPVSLGMLLWSCGMSVVMLAPASMCWWLHACKTLMVMLLRFDGYHTPCL